MSDTTGEQVQPISDEWLAVIEGNRDHFGGVVARCAWDALVARMRAAEAKVARVEALSEEVDTDDDVQINIALGGPGYVLYKLRAALADKEGAMATETAPGALNANPVGTSATDNAVETQEPIDD